MRKDNQLTVLLLKQKCCFRLWMIRYILFKSFKKVY